MVFGGNFYGLSPWPPSKRKKIPGKEAFCPPAEDPAAPQEALTRSRRHESRNISVIYGPLPSRRAAPQIFADLPVGAGLADLQGLGHLVAAAVALIGLPDQLPLHLLQGLPEGQDAVD